MLLQQSGARKVESHEVLAGWARDYAAWAKRDLSDRRYVYWWASDVNVSPRGASPDRHRLLAIFGVKANGTKALVALTCGARASRTAWLGVLQDLRARGLAQGPLLATGERDLRFWAALDDVYPRARHQHCWIKTSAAILRTLPKASQPQARAQLSEIWSATNRDDAQAALDRFVAAHEAYPKTAAILTEDRDALLAFYDFPAEHWHHLRATHPIGSTFASVRRSIAQTKGATPQPYFPGLAFRLVQESEKSWRRIRGHQRIAELLARAAFKDGEPQGNET